MRWLTLFLALAVAASCSRGSDRRQVHEARRLIAAHCAACHQVPGMPSATGRVGPSLAQIGKQQIIAGHFANTPGALTLWIEHPQQQLPGDAMPEMGLSHDQVRTIVDYLYTME